MAYAVTSPLTARVLLRGQLRFLGERGFDVTLLCAPSPELDRVAEREKVRVVPIPMQREIDPLGDARALVAMTRVLRDLRPAIVNASTPKAGLLGMLAARAAGIPHRIYTLRGLRLETTRGARRALLSATERLAAACATHVLCVSTSLRDACVAAGLASAGKTTVLGDGSSNGVDVARFDPGRTSGAAARLRAELGLTPASTPVVGFVGRLTRDKGVACLLDAFDRLRPDHPDARLLLVGPLEAGDPLPPRTVDRLRADPLVTLAGHVDDPAPFYALMDVLAFPSHREGFPNAPLEAAAAGVPTVGYRVTGTVDAVVHGQTGLLVDRGDAAALAHALSRYLGDRKLRATHGNAARDRARARFAREIVWNHLAAFYDRLCRPG